MIAAGVANLGGSAAVLGLRILLVGAERVLLRRLGEDAGPTECAAAFFGIGALVLLPFAGFGHIQDWTFLRLAVPSGLVYAVAYWFYVSALATGDVTAVAPLSATNSLFVILLASLVHGESLTLAKVGGSVMIAAGAAFLQRGDGRAAARKGGSLRSPIHPATLQMLTYAALTAITRMLDKANAVAAASTPAGTYGFAVFAVVALCECGLLLTGGGMARLRRLIVRQPVVALAAGGCNGGSFLLLLMALTLVPVSVAEPVTAVSLLVTAALAAIWFREPVGARLLPTLAVVGGTWLLMSGGAVPTGGMLLG